MTTPESRTVEATDVFAAIERAERAVDDLCSGKLRWEMRVPAEPDHDPDLIISKALVLAKDALEAAAKEHGLVIGEGELDVERLIEAAWKSGILTGSQQQGERAVRILAAYYLGHGGHPMDGYRYDGCPACAALKGVALESRR